MAKTTTSIGDILAETLKRVPDLDTGREQIEYIDIERILPDPKNFYSLDGIEDLMANIETIGLQQPLRVREAPDGAGKVIVVSGHRRREAISRLVAEGRTQLREVPCIRERGEASSALQELRLIYANADTRAMTSADLSRQAERVEALLYELKEEGFEFPGRMRDHVAEACKISKSKLARLKVIREGLIPDYRKLWETGKIDEAPAYELARMARTSQLRFYQAVGKKIPAAEKISKMREIMEKGAEYYPALKCPGTDKPCGHGDAFLRRDVNASTWDRQCKGKTCCMNCEYGGKRRLEGWSESCDSMCSKAKALVARRREDLKAAEERQEKAKLTKQQHALQASAQRIVRAADAAGLGDDVSLRDRYGSGYDVGQLRAWSKGNFEPPYNRMPYSFVTQIRPVDSDEPAKWAETLHCSIDYLYGLTDDLQIEQPKAMPGETAEWISRKDPPIGALVLTYTLTNAGASLRAAVWNGEAYFAPGNPKKILTGLKPTAWIRVPYVNSGETLRISQPAAAGWQTGTPPEDGLYWCAFDCGGQLMYMAADFRAEITDELRNVWKFPHGAKIDATCVRWHRLPEKEG